MALIVSNVCIGLIKNNKEQILLSQRTKYDTGAGLWELPGGTMEASEQQKETLYRELHEEVNITCEQAHYLLSVKFPTKNKMIHLHLWNVVRWSGNVAANENQNLDWVFITQLKSYDLLPGTLAILRQLSSHVGYNEFTLSC
jgi:8-oxo-dGTP diphosphatase